LKKVGYFPGCSLHGTAIEYDESLQELCNAFEIELVEIKDWNCCGATAAHSLNKTLAVALPVRNLALAEAQGLNEILVPCAACFNRLASASIELKHSEALRRQIPDVIELNYSGSVKILSIIDFLSIHITPELKSKIENPVGKTAACYYGCLLTRPKEIIHHENYENPDSMEKLVEMIGCKTLDWPFKTECCGAGLSVSKTDIVAKLSGKIIDDAVSRGAQIIVAACPMCQSNLDMRRKEINRYLGKVTDIPVVYITQLIGMAIGIPEKKLGFSRHTIRPEKILFADRFDKALKQKARVI
jgi:heterodisulfide reductase subunit B